MNYAEERQKINIAVAKYEADLNRKVFEDFFKEGKEQELLIYETTFDERGNLFCYKRMMWQKFKIDDILDEMKNPEIFFQRGWFFPEVKPKLEKDVVTGEEESVYHLHTSIPPQFFASAKFMGILQNSLNKFWNSFYIENCKDYDINQLELGYKNGINTMQLKAMQNLKNKIEILKKNQSICDEKEKVLIQEEQKKCSLQLTTLLNTPLFQTDLQTSKKIYKNCGFCPQNKNKTK